ncbi:hypothetical protein QMA09_16900 [Planococcus sp. APC 3906]|uniref:hypothetical protein n=1 Tax=Planococcus sp. APC 3906 TaxID=3035194 RepID=UPI0025B5AF55|nr:hypothetical protein [Planococcus sp. APC 3906]MDN3451871.1 hypothetical protein [Planococcus sp. APC 3906]
MNKISLSRVIGAFIGFVAGSIGGAFLGLVVGGTFLGGLDIYESTGFEGYELTAYIGAIIGAIVMTIAGAEFARRIVDKKG